VGQSFQKINKILEEDEDTFDKFLTSSTENADYIIHPGKHDKPTQVSTELLENFDAIVLEAAGKPYEQIDIEKLYDVDQYEEIINKNLNKAEKPLYLLDSPLEEPRNISMAGEASFHAFVIAPICGLGTMITPEAAIGALPGLTVGLSLLEIDKYDETIAPYQQISMAPTSLGFRSAITAEKLEKLPEKLDSEKPNIMVDYGAIHSDIKSYLEFPRLRNLNKKFHSLHGFGKRDESYFEKACKFEYREKSYQNSHTDRLENYYKKRIVDI
jgi:hypothetical protein